MAGRLARLCTRTRESSELVTVGREASKTFSVSMPFSLREVFCGTVFAYGQTGSGKMHTMEGATSENVAPRSHSECV